MTLQSGGNSASSCFSWCKVWTGVKCNFYSAQHQVRNVVGKLSTSRVRMWNFTRIGHKIKKLWLSINPARSLSEHPGLGPPQKGVNCNFSLPEFNKPYDVRKLWSRKVKYAVSAALPKDKNYSSFNFLAEDRKISLNCSLWCGSRGIDNFSLSQLFGQYGNGKLSITWLEICNFQQGRT